MTDQNQAINTSIFHTTCKKIINIYNKLPDIPFINYFITYINTIINNMKYLDDITETNTQLIRNIYILLNYFLENHDLISEYVVNLKAKIYFTHMNYDNGNAILIKNNEINPFFKINNDKMSGQIILTKIDDHSMTNIRELTSNFLKTDEYIKNKKLLDESIKNQDYASASDVSTTFLQQILEFATEQQISEFTTEQQISEFTNDLYLAIAAYYFKTSDSIDSIYYDRKLIILEDLDIYLKNLDPINTIFDDYIKLLPSDGAIKLKDIQCEIFNSPSDVNIYESDISDIVNKSEITSINSPSIYWAMDWKDCGYIDSGVDNNLSTEYSIKFLVNLDNIEWYNKTYTPPDGTFTLDFNTYNKRFYYEIFRGQNIIGPNIFYLIVKNKEVENIEKYNFQHQISKKLLKEGSIWSIFKVVCSLKRMDLPINYYNGDHFSHHEHRFSPNSAESIMDQNANFNIPIEFKNYYAKNITYAYSSECGFIAGKAELAYKYTKKIYSGLADGSYSSYTNSEIYRNLNQINKNQNRCYNEKNGTECHTYGSLPSGSSNGLPNFGLWNNDWVNQGEWICRNILTAKYKYMENASIGEKEILNVNPDTSDAFYSSAVFDVTDVKSNWENEKKIITGLKAKIPVYNEPQNIWGNGNHRPLSGNAFNKVGRIYQFLTNQIEIEKPNEYIIKFRIEYYILTLFNNDNNIEKDEIDQMSKKYFINKILNFIQSGLILDTDDKDYNIPTNDQLKAILTDILTKDIINEIIAYKNMDKSDQKLLELKSYKVNKINLKQNFNTGFIPLHQQTLTVTKNYKFSNSKTSTTTKIHISNPQIANYEPIPESISHEIELTLYVQPAPGDGACLAHAILMCIKFYYLSNYLDIPVHIKNLTPWGCRKLLVNFINYIRTNDNVDEVDEERRQNYIQILISAYQNNNIAITIETLLQSLLQSTYSLGEETMGLLAYILNFNILHYNNSTKLWTDMGNNPVHPYIYIKYVNNNHYDCYFNYYGKNIDDMNDHVRDIVLEHDNLLHNSEVNQSIENTQAINYFSNPINFNTYYNLVTAPVPKSPELASGGGKKVFLIKNDINILPSINISYKQFTSSISIKNNINNQTKDDNFIQILQNINNNNKSINKINDNVINYLSTINKKITIKEKKELFTDLYNLDISNKLKQIIINIIIYKDDTFIYNDDTIINNNNDKSKINIIYDNNSKLKKKSNYKHKLAEWIPKNKNIKNYNNENNKKYNEIINSVINYQTELYNKYKLFGDYYDELKKYSKDKHILKKINYIRNEKNLKDLKELLPIIDIFIQIFMK